MTIALHIVSNCLDRLPDHAPGRLRKPSYGQHVRGRTHLPDEAHGYLTFHCLPCINQAPLL